MSTVLIILIVILAIESVFLIYLIFNKLKLHFLNKDEQKKYNDRKNNILK